MDARKASEGYASCARGIGNGVDSVAQSKGRIAEICRVKDGLA